MDGAYSTNVWKIMHTKFLVDKRERPLGRQTCRLRDNIKLYLINV